MAGGERERPRPRPRRSCDAASKSENHHNNKLTIKTMLYYQEICVCRNRRVPWHTGPHPGTSQGSHKHRRGPFRVESDPRFQNRSNKIRSGFKRKQEKKDWRSRKRGATTVADSDNCEKKLRIDIVNVRKVFLQLMGWFGARALTKGDGNRGAEQKSAWRPKKRRESIIFDKMTEKLRNKCTLEAQKK